MIMVRAILLLLVPASSLELSMSANENPIRRIVNLLQGTQKKVEEEGEKMEEMFEKYMCYCETNTKTLAVSIDELTEAVPQGEASVKGLTETKAQLEEELKTHKADREAANGAIEEATSQREKDKAAFDAYSAEAKANIAAVEKAVAAIRKGMGDAFLQTGSAQLLQKVLLQTTKLSDFDQEEMASFLQGKMGAGGTGEIVGILSQMGEEMAADLKEAEEEEASSVQDFEALTAAKNKEIAAATSAIEDKTERVGKVAVDIVNAKQELADTQEALADDTSYLAELKKSCAEQTKLFDIIKKTRAEELAAIGATIKILNDDDALDLFKKTLPSPSLMQESLLQVRASTHNMERVRALLREVSANKAVDRNAASTQVAQLMQLALAGKKVGFEKIIKMMDDMVVLLGKEQKDDEEQKAYCEAEFEKSEDETVDLKRKIKGTDAVIAEGEDAIAALKEDIASLTTGIADLDKAVAEATATRKKEAEEYTTTKAANSAAVQLLEVAKNQLAKFYNPTTYKPPPQQELTEEERIYVANGGVLTTAAPGGIAGTGISFVQLKARSDVPPPPPPMAVEAYKKSDSSGPVAMLDKLMNDLKLEMKEDDMEEETAQKDYEEVMAKSADKRAMMSKRIVEKEGELAATEERLAKAKKTNKAQKTDLMDLGEYVASLHGECDWLLQNFDKRKEARSNEIDAIKKAKAVLSGADFTALVQTDVTTKRAAGFLGKKSEEQCSVADDEAHRVALLQSAQKLQKRVKDACEDMCKATGAYPACNCPNFEPPDATPGVVTWDELYGIFDSLKDEGREMLKKYTKISSA